MNLKKILKRIKLAESSISTLLGVFVVLIVFSMIFNKYFHWSKRTEPNYQLPSEILEEEETEAKNRQLPTTYIVKQGDCLWNISLIFYNSGYNWIDISKENKIKDPNLIFPGQKLAIPAAERRMPTPEGKMESIIDSTYTVKKGDNLWSIALRAYGDGYRWVQIAKTNKLSNPNLIHPGNILSLPR